MSLSGLATTISKSRMIDERCSKSGREQVHRFLERFPSVAWYLLANTQAFEKGSSKHLRPQGRDTQPEETQQEEKHEY